MSIRTGLIFKESESKIYRRRRAKLFEMMIPLGASLTFVFLMLYFWLRGHHSFEMPSVLFIPIFIVFFNSFSVFSYIQMKRIRPLRIYDWGIITPEPNILSLKQIKFSNINRVLINRYCRFTAIFMSIYGKNGELIEIIGGLDEDDVDRIQRILEGRGISVENKI